MTTTRNRPELRDRHRCGAMICAVTMLAALPAPGHAQQPAEAEEAKRYYVEAIVFEYTQSVGTGSEIFVPDVPEELPDEETIPDGEDGTMPGAEIIEAAPPAPQAEDEELLQPEFLVAPAEELRMTNVIDMLERVDVYEPVYHAGWTQQAPPREDGITIDLDMLREPPPGLSGSFTLYLSRFLHLVVDLSLDDESNGPVAVDVPTRFGFMRPPERRPAVVYRINEDRIFKSGDTRYFDHPKFGVIVRIERVEEEEESAAGDFGDGRTDEFVQ